MRLSRHAVLFLRFAAAAYIAAGVICAGLFWDVFGFVDRVNAYILATQLLHSMIRSAVPATMMTLLIDILSGRTGE